ncbi:hypothetical protein ACFX13_003779 [Malus domestica]|uniref:Uncharacterized protein n=1 Tax=Malus domestica TaxID=3750 RepID=A0A498IX00_MALDO|nr:hypothetical protein DVH24_034768 [Malus domestica]
MAKLVLLIALCVLSALAAATGPMKTPFTVEGKVYCDTCCAGYETKAITYIVGAKIQVATVLVSLCKENELRGNLFQDRAGEVGVGERELDDGQQ